MTAITGATLAMSSTAMARENVIAIPYEQEAAWDELAMTNDDAVSTGVNIRAAANEDSTVIGYLYQGGAAWVIEKGEEWTEIYSGGLTGFVRNEYLVYGSEVTGLADAYGREGVATTWDDVKLYADGDVNSEVLDSLDSGEAFILAEDDGHWLQVQKGADDTAYVSSEDVARVLLLDTAIARETEDEETAGYNEDISYDAADDTDYSYGGTADDADYSYDAADDTDDSYDAADNTDYSYDAPADRTDYSYDETYTDNTDYSYDASADSTDYSYDETYTDSTDYSYDETYTDNTDYSYDASADSTDYSYDETYTDSSSEDGSSDTVENQSTASLPQGIGYYDEYTGTYYDYYGNALYTGSQQIGYYDEYTGTYYDVYGEVMFTVGTGDTQTSETEAVAETEAPVVETEAPAETEASVSASSDDTTLLAAIIYCEAGNQSYEGMVAVGAVVMNRVASPSFPNTISEVIYQSGQFTPASSGALASALANGVPSTCYEAAAAALNGENPVGSALYFNTGSGKGMKIGAHQFY
jgi:hypothetical protein